LEASRRAALALTQKLKDDDRFVVPFDPELDIVVWARRAPSASASSILAQQIFDDAANQQLHFALIHLPVSFFCERWPELQPDQEDILCLRSVLMKPEHESWVERIYEILSRVSR
jgi:hypothetical protein